MMKLRIISLFATILLLLLFSAANIQGQEVLSPAGLLELKSVSGIQLHPDGRKIIFTFSIPLPPLDISGHYGLDWEY